MKAQLTVLGSTLLVVDGAPVALPARPRAVLTAVGVAAPAPVSPERLATVLWRGSPPPSAANAIQVYISAVRRGAHEAGWPGEVILHRDHGYLLEPEIQIDLRQLQVAVTQAQLLLSRDDPVGAEQLLADRTEVEVSRVLTDLPPAFGQMLRHSAQALVECARLVWLRALVESGQSDRALPLLLALCEEHPERGDAVELTARAYYATSRPAEALEQLLWHRRHLQENFGLDPGDWLADLQRRILRNDPALVPTVFGPAEQACSHTGPDGEQDAVVCARAVGAMVAGGASAVDEMPPCLHRSVARLGEWQFLIEAVTGATRAGAGDAAAGGAVLDDELVMSVRSGVGRAH